MLATELRIGNFVHYNNDPLLFEIRALCKDRVHPINIIEHDNNTVYAIDCELNQLQPIPLAPGMLEKCGFEKIDNEYQTKNKPILKWVEGNDNDWFIIYQTEYGCDWNSAYHVRTVHQLQNLYHSLTGEELIINLK